MSKWLLICGAALFIAALMRARLTHAHASIPDFSQTERQATVKALDQFQREYIQTFQQGKCTKEAILRLYRLKDEALGHMYEMHMQLPNDSEKHAQMARSITKTQHELHAFIENAKRRGDVHVHRGPIDELYYARFWRAANASDEATAYTF